ncbi:MAG: FAD-binding protein [Actinomycetota bacterium]
MAGLSAAVAARETGASVLVLDRATSSEHGGNTRYTEAFLRMKSVSEVADALESHFHENAAGLVDPALISETLNSPEKWSPLLRSLSFADPTVVSAFADASGPTLQWLQGFGIRFEPLPSPFITTATSRLAPVGGGAQILESLVAEAQRTGVEFAFETTATDLLREGHAIVGVEGYGAGHRSVTFRGRQVVLASGGFEGNQELLTRYIGPKAVHTRPVAKGGYYNKGEGIEMALRAGAAPCGDYGLFHAEPIDPRSGIAEPALFIFPYGLLVNSAGHRFVDEAPATVDATYESITRRIFDQEGGSAFVVLDAKLADVPNRQVAIRTDQPPLQAESLEGLAALMGVPPVAFARTVGDYNAACPDGDGFDPLRVDGLATEGLEIPKSNWSRPIDSAPFQAYPIAAANVFTFGGLKVDAHAQVLDRDGNPIPGLYAAGETVGLYFGTYTGSTSVLKGAVFGRLAGMAATTPAAS